MDTTAKLENMISQLDGFITNEGEVFRSEIIRGNEVDTIQVVVEGREEFPIFITVDDDQILAITHLWTEDQIKDGAKEALLSEMNALNLMLPLSSFSQIGEQYVIFGSLSSNSGMDDITEEVDVLSDNTLEAIEALSEYLN